MCVSFRRLRWLCLPPVVILHSDFLLVADRPKAHLHQKPVKVQTCLWVNGPLLGRLLQCYLQLKRQLRKHIVDKLVRKMVSTNHPLINHPCSLCDIHMWHNLDNLLYESLLPSLSLPEHAKSATNHGCLFSLSVELPLAGSETLDWKHVCYLSTWKRVCGWAVQNGWPLLLQWSLPSAVFAVTLALLHWQLAWNHRWGAWPHTPPIPLLEVWVL